MPQMDCEATSFAKLGTVLLALSTHVRRPTCAMCSESLQDRVSLVADGAALARDVADAALAGDEAALQSAIEAGADVNSANLKGVHPLMIAARDASVECVLLLLDAGADLHRATRKGCTALHLARVQRKRWLEGQGMFIAKPAPTDDAAIARIIKQFDDVIDIIESRAIDKTVAESAADVPAPAAVLFGGTPVPAAAPAAAGGMFAGAPAFSAAPAAASSFGPLHPLHRLLTGQATVHGPRRYRVSRTRC